MAWLRELMARAHHAAADVENENYGAPFFAVVGELGVFLDGDAQGWVFSKGAGHSAVVRNVGGGFGGIERAVGLSAAVKCHLVHLTGFVLFVTHCITGVVSDCNDRPGLAHGT